MLSDDGKKAEFDSPENLKALQLHGRRHQGRLRAEGRHDVHGGAVADALRGRQAGLHAQLAVRLRRSARRTRTRPTFKVAPFPKFEGGRQVRHARRPQRRHLGLLEEPGRRARVRRLPTRARSASSSSATEYSLPPTLASVYDDAEDEEGDPVRSGDQAGDRAGRSRARSRRSTRRSPRRSTRTSTRRSPARPRQRTP